MSITDEQTHLTSPLLARVLAAVYSGCMPVKLREMECASCVGKTCFVAKCEEIAHDNQSTGELLIILTYTALSSVLYLGL